MEMFYHLMHPLPNAIMTVLMGVMFLYWLVSFLFGAMDLDIDVDFDHDIDIEVGGLDARGLDADAHSHDPGVMMKFLEFINVGKMPFMLILTIFIFFIWIGSLIFTSFINIENLGGWSVLILIPLIICSVFCTKITTKPLVKLFLAMGYQGEDSIDFLGRDGIMVSNIEGDKIGAADFKIDSNPIRLNVKSKDGKPIKRGEYIIIEDEDKDRKYYLVSKEISLRNID